MKRMMIPVALGILCALVALPLGATERDVPLAISPNVINLKAKGPPAITAHINVPFEIVDLESVELTIDPQQGPDVTLEPVQVCMDECGDLVAKFDAEAVKDAVKPPGKSKVKVFTATFTVTLDTMEGPFEASVEVVVK